MTLVKCTQTRCSFNTAKGGQMFCPICDECQAPSNIVENDTCVNCYNCLKDEGYVRKGLPKTIKEKLKALVKEKVEKEIIVIKKTE